MIDIKRRREHPERAVECPTCGVAAGRACKSRTGHGRSESHSLRYQIANVKHGQDKGRFECEDCGQVYVYEFGLLRHRAWPDRCRGK